ncbi:DNA polymerase III subunit delta [Mycoplasma phocoeninasale]|uniref:DNA polymerase III subunit delta n=1 Tax=Mycoplasma phocoeninasale TaxID=2726117 RepID=UPI001966D9C6|nr:DNA polymerase III subunit delta [Mycoplasma phocoeninasale]MBN0970785.1 DNA polymerase III subunit delta [Mycoplasma phocoeninasale]
MYLIKGNENYFIKLEIKKIIDKLKKEHNNLEIHTFFQSINLQELSDVLFNSDIFSTPKVIIVENPDFFNSKIKINHDKVSDFLFFLKNEIDTNTIIFTQEIQKYDRNFSPSSVFKEIEKQAKIVEVNKIADRDLAKYIKKLVKEKGGEIDEYALSQFLTAVPNDLTLIESEIDKLLLQDSHITEAMIISGNVVSSSNTDFAFSDAILKQLSAQIILFHYNEQLNYGVSAAQIISQIANIFVTAKNIAILKSNRFSQEEISNELNIHIYRVKLFQEFLNKITTGKLNFLIQELAKLELEIKKGNIEEELGLKWFMLNLIR